MSPAQIPFLRKKTLGEKGTDVPKPGHVLMVKTQGLAQYLTTNTNSVHIC